MVKSGVLPTQEIAAGDMKVISIPTATIKYKENCDYYLRVSFHEKEDKFWCEKGYEVAYEQMLVKGKTQPLAEQVVAASKTAVTVNNGSESVVVSNKDFSVTINKKSGYVTSYTKGGIELMKSPLMPNFTRPATDNDVKGANAGYMKRANTFWNKCVSTLKVKSVDVKELSSTSTAINVVYQTNEGVNLAISYTVNSNAMVSVKMDMDAANNVADVVNFGMKMGVPYDYSTTTFYGKGPFENYYDRQSGAEMGVYTFATDDLFYNYAKSQETGNRTNVEWVNMKSKGSTFKFIGQPKFYFKALAYTSQNIDKALHPYDLERAGYYEVCIASEQIGIGETLSEILPIYKISAAGKRTLEFTFGATK